MALWAKHPYTSDSQSMTQTQQGSWKYELWGLSLTKNSGAGGPNLYFNKSSGKSDA